MTGQIGKELESKVKSDRLNLLSINRPEVFMVYRLINHAGRWKNTQTIRKTRAAGETRKVA